MDGRSDPEYSLNNSRAINVKKVIRRRQLYLVAIFSYSLLLIACAHQEKNHSDLGLENTAFLPEADVNIEIPSLSNCTDSEDDVLHFNSREPVTVIVHGCLSSAGQFRSLADVFAFHGQQTVCFNYDDRASLKKSSSELRTAVEQLSEVLQQPEIAVIGHSQGGLVSRRAFIDEPEDRLDAANADINLVTISAPFGGIEAATHCGVKKLVWLSLGAIKPICRIIAGKKYSEIPPNSDFISDPGQLIPLVNQHLKIVTDELDSCRQYDAGGVCIEDDYVFSLHEQSQQVVDRHNGLTPVIVKAGHVEIVGDGTTVPKKLIEILQQQGIMRSTPSEEKDELAQLMAHLYLTPST